MKKKILKVVIIIAIILAAFIIQSLWSKQNSNIESIPGESLKLVGRAAGAAEIFVQLKKYP